ncbi:helix-turn-helix domain-containing protein [Microvirga makkahensis]|uniref:Helix-turn-helix domain-containing protein n=1 Tax=Microvirga makkahensis TaxID=1128670 RepID=A0A7X3MXJ3_9HYPH|nr:helix-turn-helix domain-containing protein [Microvirga makkahensis]
MSSSHFIKSFSTSFGQSPHQYLVNLRLASAEKPLVETDLPLSHIAYVSGFSSQSHITATMRRYKLATPGEIRRRKEISPHYYERRQQLSYALCRKHMTECSKHQP